MSTAQVLKPHPVTYASMEIAGEITAETERRWRDELHRLSLGGADHRCLFLNINTPGGSVLAAARVAGAINAWRGPTFGHVRNKCESAGMQVLAACERRSADIGAVIEFHAPALDEPMQPGDVTALISLRRQMARQIARGLGRPVAEIERFMATRARLTAREAEAAGILHLVHMRPAQVVARGGGGQKLSVVRM